MISEDCCSTQKQPIRNFVFLFQYDGFNALRKDFLKYVSDDDIYDSSKETISFFRGMREDPPHDYYYITSTFKDHLCTFLNEQCGLSCKNIDNHIYELNSDSDAIRNYLEVTLSGLENLLIEIEKDNDLNKYDNNKIFINKLIAFIHNKYGVYLSNEITVKNDSITSSNDDDVNPYPRIFTSSKAYDKFKKLLDEFGNTKMNVANYTFVYHRMVEDKFIYDDYKQTEFCFFLLDFEINIERIKPKNQQGSLELRESIYNRV